MGDGVRPRVVLYTASWCAVCARVAPLTRQIATDYDGVDVLIVDVDDHPDASIRGVPAFAIRSAEGVETARSTGALDEDQIRNLFAAAENDTSPKAFIDSQTRIIRIGSGATLIGLGVISSTPVVLVLGAAALVWGVADLVGSALRGPV